MNAYKRTGGSSFWRKLAEFRPLFVVRLFVLFVPWIVFSALLSLLIVSWEFFTSRLFGPKKRDFNEL